MVVMMFRIALRPLVEHSISRIFRMTLFWHFLDFVWIFIFTVVYGIGYLLVGLLCIMNYRYVLQDLLHH